MNQKENLISFLNNNHIDYKEYPVPDEKFPPEASFWKEQQIIRCKNLFFRDNHGKNHFLVILGYEKKLNIKELQKITGRGSMTLASRERLAKYLNLQPGYISLFGLLNDKNKEVNVIIDQDLDQNTPLSFLPNTKGGSFFALKFSEVLNFLKKKENPFRVEKL